jgi:inward rectifier potassium channel
MAFTKKINTGSKINPDTGFGEQASQIGGRFVNKDGSFNLRKEGWPLSKTTSLYSLLLELSWLKLLAVIVLFYVFINVVFTTLYLLAGTDQLTGLVPGTRWTQIKEVFYFSTQTFTTVGYGRVNPVATALTSLLRSKPWPAGFSLRWSPACFTAVSRSRKPTSALATMP